MFSESFHLAFGKDDNKERYMSFDDFKHPLKFEEVYELGHSSTYYKPSTVDDSCISIYEISLEPFIVEMSKFPTQ